MCRNTEMCRIPPPPPRLGLARLSTLVALREEKKVSEFPPPRSGWRRSKKKQCVVPPFKKILDPPLDVIN